VSLKLLLISVDGTLGHDGAINDGIARDLGRLVKELVAMDVKVAFWSNKTWKINAAEPLAAYFSRISGVDVKLHGLAADNMPARSTGQSAAPIMQLYGAQPHETMLVGGMEEDMRAAVNNKLLLIRPDWYGAHMDYGFPMSSVSELARFCMVFALRQHPIFWRVRSGSLDISAGGPFSTMNENYAVFGADARAFAKQGRGNPDFWFYFTISSLYFSGLLDGVKYICSYPGHLVDSADADERGIAATLVRLGKCLNKGYYHDLIVRHTDAPKSQHIKAAERKFGTQLSTIRLNKRPHKNLSEHPNKTDLKIKNETILVVDDFCTSGRSSEAARLYLQAAGATARLYTWLKTINTSYEEALGDPGLKAYMPNERGEPERTQAHGYHAAIVAPKAPAEIQEIFEKYVGWKW